MQVSQKCPFGRGKKQNYAERRVNKGAESNDKSIHSYKRTLARKSSSFVRNKQIRGFEQVTMIYSSYINYLSSAESREQKT